MNEFLAIRGTAGDRVFYTCSIPVSVLKELETTKEKDAFAGNIIFSENAKAISWTPINVNVDDGDKRFSHLGIIVIEATELVSINLSVNIYTLQDTDLVPVVLLKNF